MVAQTPPIPFAPDPARVEEFLEDISCFDMCLRDVAKKHGTTLGGLALYITSEDGLQTIATSELAAALRIRLTALHLLPDVVQAMGYIVNEYAREERRIPMENSLRRIRLLELKRRNAHRAGTLIFKLAHFNPRPIKSYTVRPAAQSDFAAESVQACGMPKRPLGHGSTTEIKVAVSRAVEVVGSASTPMNASAVQDDFSAHSARPTDLLSRPLEHGSAINADSSLDAALAGNSAAVAVLEPEGAVTTDAAPQASNASIVDTTTASSSKASDQSRSQGTSQGTRATKPPCSAACACVSALTVAGRTCACTPGASTSKSQSSQSPPFSSGP